MTRLISKTPAGGPAHGTSSGPQVNRDCTEVAFDSFASNLVRPDNPGTQDVYLRDRGHRALTLISRARGGEVANEDSHATGISATGRYVAFQSAASNLVKGDRDGQPDVFLRDTATETTELISVAAGHKQADGSSGFAAVSASGRFVVFESDATTLVSGDTNAATDIFLRDRHTGTTTRVSTGLAGAEANGDSSFPTMSASGRLIAFDSTADNLVEGDTNGQSDSFVYNARTEEISLVSVASGVSGPANDASFGSAISPNGQYVAFVSAARDLVPGITPGIFDVFVRDLHAGVTTVVSRGTNGSEPDNVSAFASVSDGGQVAFQSDADNLLVDDANNTTDVFVFDLASETTSVVSLSSSGEQGDDASFGASISADSRCVGFTSDSDNLAPRDNKQVTDNFLRRLVRRR